MYLFPAIDLIEGKVVRLRQGDFGRRRTYEADPVEQAGSFEAAGATWLHMVDLDGARTGEPRNVAIVKQVCRQTKLKVEVGGGVRDRGAIEALLAAGVERVILGTAALTNWAWFEGLMEEEALHGRIVLGLDARGGKLAVSGWEDQLEADAFEVAGKVSDWPLGAINFTDIGVEGMCEGPNVEAMRRMTESTRVAVVASGGVGALDHLRQLREVEALEGVIVGRAIYDGAFTAEEGIGVLEKGE